MLIRTLAILCCLLRLSNHAKVWRNCRGKYILKAYCSSWRVHWHWYLQPTYKYKRLRISFHTTYEHIISKMGGRWGIWDKRTRPETAVRYRNSSWVRIPICRTSESNEMTIFQSADNESLELRAKQIPFPIFPTHPPLPSLTQETDARNWMTFRRLAGVWEWASNWASQTLRWGINLAHLMHAEAGPMYE